MRTVALIAIVAILAMSLGGIVSAHSKGCCGTAIPAQANTHGAGLCVGHCALAVKVSPVFVGYFLFSLLLLIPLGQSLPLRADPIDKPPA